MTREHLVLTICEQLLGSCESLERALELENLDFYNLTKAEYAIIDDTIAKCETCDWWCEPYEIEPTDHGNECADCRNAN